MSIFNLMKCATQDGNTGIPASCTHNPKELQYMLAVPKGTVWSASDLAVIRTTIQNGLVNDTYTSRYHLFGEFAGITDNSEERTQQTFGYGVKVTVRGERYYWDFQYEDGAFCAHRAYLQFKGRENEFDFFFIDSDYNCIGTESFDSEGAVNGMKGVKVTDLYENNWKPADGTNMTTYMLSVGMSDAKQLNEHYAVANLGFDISDLNNIQDVELTATSTLASDVVSVSMLAACGGQNMIEDFSALAATTVYDFLEESTGNALDVDSITITGVGENKVMSIDFDNTDPDYPSVGEYLTIKTKSPSTVEGIQSGLWIESNLLRIKRAS